MLTCEQAARLISEGLDRRLSLRERLHVRLHVAFCRACSAYRRQLRAIERLAAERFGPTEPPGEARLSAEARVRIRAALHNR